MRILFVCLGNICRSPTAEAVARRLAPEHGLDWTFDSAGTGDWHVGDPPYEPMIKAAQARGYPMADLRARQFVFEDFERFDWIFVMDRSNLENVRRLLPNPSNHPDLATPKLLLDHVPELGLSEVPDPYYTRDFEQTVDLMELAIERLLRDISTG